MIELVLNISVIPLFFLNIILISWFLLFFISSLSKNNFKSIRLKKFPKVSIIIPAYNEENTIESTLINLKKQNYPNMEIIVIDDGSKDNTYKVAKKYAKVYRFKENRGKHYALNFGIKKAKGSYILIIDADTIFKDRSAIKNLIKYFYLEKNIAAVTSALKVLNKKNILTIFQNLEYNYQNLIRFGFNSLKLGTLYIWGCATMFKKNVIKKIMFRESYTEDLDTIIRIQMKNYKVVLAKDVIAYTIVPDNVKSYIKQRLRWSYIIFQCFKDYKHVFFNRKYSSLGLYSLPLTIFWFPFAIINTPLIIFQIFYWLQFQETFSDIFIYLFLWFSFFGNLNYLKNILTGSWQLHIGSLLGVSSGLITFILMFIALIYFKEYDKKDFALLFFIFPYFLFHNIILILFLFIAIMKKFGWYTK